MMMNGASSVFFMKQQDFLLLGIDHLVNTYNIIRNKKYQSSNSSFTIFPITVDNGFQGPQSSLNNFGDFCSIARIPGYTITNKWDAEKIITSNLVSPGFRVITISQRLFKDEILTPEPPLFQSHDLTVFQYSNGNDATIVCFNFSFPQGLSLLKELKEHKINASLFNVNSPIPTNWEKIIDDAKKTKKLILIDDSKSENLSCDNLLMKISKDVNLEKNIAIKRRLDDNWVCPVSDEMTIDIKRVISELTH